MWPWARRVEVRSLLAAAALAGCGDDLGPEQERPNLPPETILSGGAPDSTCDASYRVRLAWDGADADGAVDHFDVILIDHPAIDDSMGCAAGDPVDWTPLAPDDPRWVATNSRDTVIVARADTLRRDPRPPPGAGDREIGEHNRLVRMQSFERWHTFFVRAVDDRGAADPTPQHVSFNATTLAPEVRLLPPIDPDADAFHAPRLVVFRWEGRDPVGDGTFIEPIASRWVMLPTRPLPGGGYAGYPQDLYDLPAGSSWSEWRRWDASDGSGRQVTVDSLHAIEDAPGRGFYLFAVQAMDEAGAVTPVFDATTAGQNNVARVLVRGDVGPVLFVDGGSLGVYAVTLRTRPVTLTAAGGQPIRFRWRGDASRYGGSIVAYRYGWNLGDRDEWTECGMCLEAPTRVFDAGTQEFHLEALDNAGTTTRVVIELEVRAVTRRRDLLLVDDTDNFDSDPQNPEAREDERWLAIVDAWWEQPFPFDPERDVYDVVRHRRRNPPLELVFDYKTIVWYAKIASSGYTSLRDLAGFFDPFASGNLNFVPRYNYLQAYLDNGGEFWLSGQQLTDLLWRFPAGVQRPYPFEVTNWFDPTHPPGVDSVGVQSFLWRMGAEAVDYGGGGRGPARRDNSQHYCAGFRRATPPAVERQTFRSSRAADHAHELVVLTADIETAPPAGVTYVTTTAQTHTHTVTLAQGQLRRLAAGDLLDVRTSVASEPSTHSHTFQLVDQVGLWGAPQQLVPDTPYWATSPNGGRHSVEIYNMPFFLAAAMPPLQPDPRLWLRLYDYASVTPADPEQGIVYPQTADGEPAIILRKAKPTDWHYSRALCGFELWRLQARSHQALADFVLRRHFRLGLPDAQ